MQFRFKKKQSSAFLKSQGTTGNSSTLQNCIRITSQRFTYFVLLSIFCCVSSLEKSTSSRDIFGVKMLVETKKHRSAKNMTTRALFPKSLMMIFFCSCVFSPTLLNIYIGQCEPLPSGSSRIPYCWFTGHNSSPDWKGSKNGCKNGQTATWRMDKVSMFQ